MGKNLAAPAYPGGQRKNESERDGVLFSSSQKKRQALRRTRPLGKTPVAPARPRPNHSGCVYGYRDGERERERDRDGGRVKRKQERKDRHIQQSK